MLLKTPFLPFTSNTVIEQHCINHKKSNRSIKNLNLIKASH